MLIKKAMLVLATSLFAFCLFACNAETTTPSTSLSTTATTTASPTTTSQIPVTTAPTDTIYVSYPDEAYAELTGLDTYRAEYGYYLMSEQGYNNWYYETFSDLSEFSEMTYNAINWQSGSALIMNSLMSPSSANAAVRTFVCPVSGEATIYGTFRSALESAHQAEILIMVNDVQIYPETGYKELNGNDLEGYYHNLSYSLEAGDEVRFIVLTDAMDNPLVYWNPVVDYLNVPDDYIHYGMTDYVGDVHPYYYDGKLNMYYLSRDGSFSSTLATSKDMINYESQVLTTTRLNAPGSFYYVLGVIKEGNYFRSFYGEGKNVGSSRSLDLLEWESGIIWDEETYEKLYSPGSNYPAGIRDPYAYYNPDLKKNHIVATGYKANQHYVWSNTTGYDAFIVLFTSIGPSLSDWEKNPVTGRVGYHIPLLHFGDWVNNVDIGDPECSQIFKIGDRWYILASMSGRGGDHWVGRPSYWVGDANVDILAMDWQANIDQEYTLDGEDLCAAQVYEVNDKLYLAGWITQKNYPYGWGGTINIPREIYQKEDGTLGSRLDDDLTKLLNSGNLFDISDNESTISGFEQSGDSYSLSEGEAIYGYQQYGYIKAEGTYKRTIINLDLSLSEATEAAGILIGGADKDVEIGIRANGEAYELYLKNQGAMGKVSATYIVSLDDLEHLDMTIILEGDVAEIYLNGEYAMSARSSEILSDDVTLSVFASGLGTQINDFRINQLTPAKDFGH